jgi:hypothetical protein
MIDTTTSKNDDDIELLFPVKIIDKKPEEPKQVPVIIEGHVSVVVPVEEIKPEP